MENIQSVAALEALVQQKKREEEKKKPFVVEGKKGSEEDPYAAMDTYEMAFKIGTGEITDPRAIPLLLEKQRAYEKEIVHQALSKYPEQQTFIERKTALIDAQYDLLRDGGAAAQARYCADNGTALSRNKNPQAQTESSAWFAMSGRLAFSELAAPTTLSPVESTPVVEPAPAAPPPVAAGGE